MEKGEVFEYLSMCVNVLGCICLCERVHVLVGVCSKACVCVQVHFQ